MASIFTPFKQFLINQNLMSDNIMNISTNDSTYKEFLNVNKDYIDNSGIYKTIVNHKYIYDETLFKQYEKECPVILSFLNKVVSRTSKLGKPLEHKDIFFEDKPGVYFFYHEDYNDKYFNKTIIDSIKDHFNEYYEISSYNLFTGSELELENPTPLKPKINLNTFLIEYYDLLIKNIKEYSNIKNNCKTNYFYRLLHINVFSYTIIILKILCDRYNDYYNNSFVASKTSLIDYNEILKTSENIFKIISKYNEVCDLCKIEKQIFIHTTKNQYKANNYKVFVANNFKNIGTDKNIDDIVDIIGQHIDIYKTDEAVTIPRNFPDHLRKLLNDKKIIEKINERNKTYRENLQKEEEEKKAYIHANLILQAEKKKLEDELVDSKNDPFTNALKTKTNNLATEIDELKIKNKKTMISAGIIVTLVLLYLIYSKYKIRKFKKSIKIR